MPFLGRLSRRGDGAWGRRQIPGVVGLKLLLFVLSWSEQFGSSSGTIFFNKLVAEDLFQVRGSQVLQVPLAGRGGGGGNLLFLARFADGSPPAGLGGEGRSGSSSSFLTQGDESMVPGGGGLQCRRYTLLSSLSYRGGKGRRSGGVPVHFGPCCLLPTRCYIDELNHAGGGLATAIFCRHGGEFSTSDEEALLRIRLWSSTSLRRQVVRPRRLGGGQRSRFLAGNGCSSNLPLFLGGDALRTPAMWRRHLRTGLRFLFLFQGVFCKVEGPFLNIAVLRASVVKGPFCNMYLPRG